MVCFQNDYQDSDLRSDFTRLPAVRRRADRSFKDDRSRAWLDSHKPVRRPADNCAEGSGSSSRRIGADRGDPQRFDRQGAGLVVMPGRMVPHRVGRVLGDLPARGVALYLHEQQIDTATSNGASLLDVAPLMVHHLRQSRRQDFEGAGGCALSIKFGRPRIATTRVEKAKRELAAGKGVRQVARLAGISPASACRIKNSMNTEAARP